MALSTNSEQIYRYEETGRTFKLQNYTEWAVPAIEGVFEDMPNWLRLIRTAAEVGGVLEENRVSYPPPMFILWFRTDAEHNLLSFGRESDVNRWWLTSQMLLKTEQITVTGVDTHENINAEFNIELALTHDTIKKAYRGPFKTDVGNDLP